MRKYFIIPVITVFGLLLTACDAGKNQGASVAVLDIEQVAEKTGHKQKINKTLQKLRIDLETELQSMQNKLRTTLEESKGKLGDKPTSEQQQELAQMLGKAQQEFQGLKSMASSSFAKQQEDLINELRETIKPIAMAIAKGRGMNVVLLRNNAQVLAYDPSADITDAVIAEINRTTLVKPEVTSETPANVESAVSEAAPQAAQETKSAVEPAAPQEPAKVIPAETNTGK